MKALLVKLSSRKFWLAVATVIALVVNHAYAEATAVVLAYLGVQGAVDARWPQGAPDAGTSKSGP